MFLLHLAGVNLGTPAEGTWMVGTALGLTWLAMWHRMTPSAKAPDTFSGIGIRRRFSMLALNCAMCASAVLFVEEDGTEEELLLGMVVEFGV